MPLFKEGDDSFFTKKPENDIASYVADTYIDWVSAVSDLRQDSRKWYDLVNCELVTPDQEQKLKSRGLPALRLPIILPKIIRILGAEREARAGVKAVPLQGGKNNIAHALTKLFEKIRVDSRGFYQIAQAWLDSIIGDIGGFLEVTYSTDNSPLGFPTYRRINPFFVVWDPSRLGYDLNRDRAIMKSWFATQDYIEQNFAYYPDGSIDGKMLKRIRETLDRGDSVGKKLMNSAFVAWEALQRKKQGHDTDFEYHKDNLYRVIEMQVREQVREIGFFDPVVQKWQRVSGREEMKGIMSQPGANGRLIEMTRKWDRIRVITTVGGDRCLLQNKEADVQNGMFSIIPFWGYRFGDKPMGIVKPLEGAQELYWKEMSSSLHILNTAANPWVFVPRGSLSDKQRKELEQWGSRCGMIIDYNPMQGHAPRRDFPTTIPSGQMMMAEAAMRQVDVTSGIGQNAVGNKDSAGESGKLVNTRVGESMANLETLFDNKEQSVILLHTYLIALIQAKMTMFRVERLTNEDEPVVLNMMTAHGIINDMTEGEYGIAIDKMSTKYHREEKFLKIMLFASETGMINNPAVLKSAIQSFDALDDGEKEEWLRSFTVDNMDQKLAEMEQQIRGQAMEARKVNVAEQQGAAKLEAERNRRQLQAA